ncbi:MAG: hypothetical protein QNL62_24170 [Gammaproteobacteria bacterium]|nr:hypothetical protein [Gammaproteobacteria bacterium]
MTDVQNANERFNTLWEEIGAKRITIGDEDKGVEIVVDADLSIFAILDKLKAESVESRRKGDLSSKDVKAINKTTKAIKKVLDGGIYERLDKRLRKLNHKD